jgi:hypothetical protein
LLQSNPTFVGLSNYKIYCKKIKELFAEELASPLSKFSALLLLLSIMDVRGQMFREIISSSETFTTTFTTEI